MNPFAYRKKPVAIEAFCWTGAEAGTPPWFATAQAQGRVLVKPGPGSLPVLDIVTPAGVLRAAVGDYIIRGVQGELYPCKPDIFVATYDRIGHGR